ncbi:MAG: DUF2946 domain-containing protein [Burkholderiaceae bacterium]
MLRLLVRCLLAGMVLAVLAPSISRWLVAGRSAGDWVQLCSSQGTRWIRLGTQSAEADEADGPNDIVAMHDLCGHCVLAAERFAPVLPTFAFRPGTDAEFAFATTVTGPGTSRTGLVLRARGPPEFQS